MWCIVCPTRSDPRQQMWTKRTAVICTLPSPPTPPPKIHLTLTTRLTAFQFRYPVSVGLNQSLAVGPRRFFSPLVISPFTIITGAYHKGITCLITQWIYIRQVIIVTTGYLWLMVCVSTVHAAFVFIWQSSLLGHAATEISLPFGWLWCVRACVLIVCVCV